jgi:hypothetical protein
MAGGVDHSACTLFFLSAKMPTSRTPVWEISALWCFGYFCCRCFIIIPQARGDSICTPVRPAKEADLDVIPGVQPTKLQSRPSATASSADSSVIPPESKGLRK